ncbi:hypothetical protein cce_1443 [Crocosphaera subtropica ATCC 51142]|uniref:Uncharacterized protein n=1 Tax=Crocosphaera subtropica (strain ATCC 51142 / BH68) TaxID=43989 RepID=B1WX49_CROS5|nr:hypothetical protein cce_1443 [Crocosphaera subtropica ATCC 51142]
MILKTIIENYQAELIGSQKMINIYQEQQMQSQQPNQRRRRRSV